MTYQWPQARTLSTSPRSQGATCLSQCRQRVVSTSESIEDQVVGAGVGVGGLWRAESTPAAGGEISSERVWRGGGRLAVRLVNDEGRVGCHKGRRVGRVPVPGMGGEAVAEKRRLGRREEPVAEGLNLRVAME